MNRFVDVAGYCIQAIRSGRNFIDSSCAKTFPGTVHMKCLTQYTLHRHKMHSPDGHLHDPGGFNHAGNQFEALVLETVLRQHTRLRHLHIRPHHVTEVKK